MSTLAQTFSILCERHTLVADHLLVILTLSSCRRHQKHGVISDTRMAILTEDTYGSARWHSRMNEHITLHEAVSFRSSRLISCSAVPVLIIEDLPPDAATQNQI